MTADVSSSGMAEPGKEIRRSPVTRNAAGGEAGLSNAKQRPGFQTAATRVALVQMQCGPEPEANLAKAVARVREAAEQGGQIICLPELFRSQYFCQSEDHANFELAEEIPGPSTAALSAVARETGAVIVASLFERRTAGLYHNTAAIIGADGELPREISQDAYPGRSFLLREVLFHPGRPRFQSLADPARQDRRLRLLGPVVSGSGPPNDLAGRRDSFLSNRDRVAPVGKSEIRLRPAFRLGNDAAQSRDRERVFRRGRQSRRSRSAGRWRWDRVLGPKLHRRASGEILAKASVDREEIIFADIEWKRVDEHRTHWPFLRDRRIDAYGGIEQRLLD